MSRLLERTAFSTSRLLDFVSEKELTLQCGYGPERLAARRSSRSSSTTRSTPARSRASRRRSRSPSTTTRSRSPTTAPGIPPSTVDRLLDFSIRVSSREAYVAPDRGAQGNALKTIVAMPFVLDGEQGRVDIVGGGVASEIAFCGRPDRSSGRSPRSSRSTRDGLVGPGSLAAPELVPSDEDDDCRFLQERARRAIGSDCSVG